MSRLLIINPNTGTATTERLHAAAVAALGAQTDVVSVTARFGAPYIACETSYAIAGHATLDAWLNWRAQAKSPEDAVLIGCFGDPGLMALREISDSRVTGLADAAFAEAAALGPFAVVTGGQRWQPMLQRLAHALGYAEALREIVTVEATGAQLAANPDWAVQVLLQACRDVLQRQRVNSIIIGGAGLLGLAARIQADLSVPLIDSVLAGVRQAALAPVGQGEANDAEKRAWLLPATAWQP